VRARRFLGRLGCGGRRAHGSGATGTDTGGSIRQPAALSGLSGLKRRTGSCRANGMIAFASSLDQGGPIAKSAEDLALLLNVMAGFDARDSTSVERAREDYARDLEKPLAGLRIGVPKEHFGEGLRPTWARRWRRRSRSSKSSAQNAFRSACPRAACRSRVLRHCHRRSFSNLSRYDGVRYGHRAEGVQRPRRHVPQDPREGFGAEVRRRILIGTYVLSHGYYDAYYLKAQRIRRLIANDFAEAFKLCDLVVGPTTPTVAFKIGAKAADPVQMYLNDLYTIPANLAGLPGMSIPCGFGKDNLPVGLAYRRELLHRGEDAERRPPVSEGDGLAQARARRDPGMNWKSLSASDACSALHGSKMFSGASTAFGAAPTHRQARWISHCPACCPSPTKLRSSGRYGSGSPSVRKGDQPPIGFRAKNYFYPDLPRATRSASTSFPSSKAEKSAL